MKKTVSGIMLTLLLIGTLVLAFTIQTAKSNPETIVVPDDYATIQKAINAANPGDTIYVRAGTYYEHVVVNKTVSLVGEDRETTTIDGSGVGTVVGVTADDVNISGFTIRNSGVPTVWPATSGIILWYSDRSTITNCNITSNGGHGFLCVTSRYYTISNSVVSHNNYIGIAIGDTGSSNGVIRNNTVYSNRGSGGIEAYAGSHYTIVENNTIYNNAWIGIAIGWSYYCVIRNNNILNNTASQIILDSADYCTVLNNNISCTSHGGITLLGLGTYSNNLLNNTIYSCGQGIGLGASARYTTISGNILSMNEYGLWITNNPGYENYGNKIFHNDFINNTYQATDKATDIPEPNVWDDGYPSGGNYWSDYTDVDLYHGPYQNITGSDGIWDHPYVINDNNRDGYPFTKPWVPAKTATVVHFDLKPNPAVFGQSVTLQGKLTTIDNFPISGEQVIVKCNGTYISTLVANSTGRFKTSGKVGSAGNFNITVEYAGSQPYLPSHDQEILVVNRAESRIYFTFIPNPVSPGQPCVLEGVLFDQFNNPIRSVMVKIEYSTNYGLTWHFRGTLTTNHNGIFSKTFPAPARGTYLVRIKYAGSQNYEPSVAITPLIVR